VKNKNNNFIPDISVIIPLKNEFNSLKILIKKIHELTFRPKDIIIVDSGRKNYSNIINNYKSDIPIIYYYENENAYPGKARNIGVKLSDSKWIAFLDVRTVPNCQWLEEYFSFTEKYESDIIIGFTKIMPKNKFQKYIGAATYGNIGHKTVPGTLIKKSIFYKTGSFIENVRMGEDIEWKERIIKNNFKLYTPSNPIIKYTGLPTKFSFAIKKYLISSYHSSKINIQRNVKDAYLTLALILSAIIIPKWNHLIGGWDTNPLYIPNVTKIFFLSSILLLLAIQIFNRIISKDNIETNFFKILKIIVFIFFTLGVYRWNAVIANWMEETILYFPHITKIYLGFVFALSILYRGLVQPLNRMIKPNFLFPFRWMIVGLLGLCLDIIKAPGYLGGAITAFIYSNKNS